MASLRSLGLDANSLCILRLSSHTLKSTTPASARCTGCRLSCRPLPTNTGIGLPRLCSCCGACCGGCCWPRGACCGSWPIAIPSLSPLRTTIATRANCSASPSTGSSASIKSERWHLRPPLSLPLLCTYRCCSQAPLPPPAVHSFDCSYIIYSFTLSITFKVKLL